jgi:hypothetical protein
MHTKLVTGHQIQPALRGATRQLTVVVPAAAAITGYCPDLTAATEAAERGVRVHLHVGPDRPGRSARRSVEPPSLGRFEVFRTAGALCRLTVVDQRIVVAAQNGLDYHDGGTVIASPALARMVERSIWSDSAPTTPSSSGSTTSGADLLHTEQAVLAQLVRGAKDDLAARDLGMATRTYRRVVAALMDRLAADSRFQAGYRAAKEGLL